MLPDKIEVTYTLSIEEEDIPVRGNFASGDDAADKALEDSIIERYNRGDLWAWCYIKVTASVDFDGRTFTGWDGLGACSYKDEADFCQPGGYYEQMKRAALGDLKSRLEDSIKSADFARRLLPLLND